MPLIIIFCQYIRREKNGINIKKPFVFVNLLSVFFSFFFLCFFFFFMKFTLPSQISLECVILWIYISDSCKSKPVNRMKWNEAKFQQNIVLTQWVEKKPIMIFIEWNCKEHTFPVVDTLFVDSYLVVVIHTTAHTNQ